MQISDEMMPCPFCGGVAETKLENNGVGCLWVICDNAGCGCEGPYKHSPTEAVEAWNLRAALVTPTDAGKVEGVENFRALFAAVKGIDDDYMTSELHHPDYVLIPTAKFEAIRTAITASPPLPTPEASPAPVEQGPVAWRWRSTLFTEWNLSDKPPVDQATMERAMELNMVGLEWEALYASPAPAPNARAADDWFSSVVSFLVKYGMLDARDEYDISDVIGALQDNYEPPPVSPLDEVRRAVIEECAKVADAERESSGAEYPGEIWIANRIATAIRALAGGAE